MTKPSSTAFNDSVRKTLTELGTLRVALFLFTLFLILIVPSAGTTPSDNDWMALLRTTLAPVFAPLILMLLLLDALMARVFMADAAGGERLRFRRILRTDLTVAFLLLLFWLPYFLALRQKVG